MNTVQVVICYALLAALTCACIVSALLKDRAKRLTRSYLFLAFMILGWQLTVIAFQLSGGGSLSLFLYDLNLPFVALSVMAALLFTLRLYNLDDYRGAVPLMLLAVIPFITTVLVLTAPWHDFVREGMQVVQVQPVIQISSTRGPWFWMHAGYCYVVSLVTLFIALARYTSLPKIYRHSSVMLLAGLTASLVGNVLFLLRLFPVPLDFSLIGASVSTACLSVSLRSSEGIETLNRAKNKLLDELSQSVWILDDSGRVAGSNLEARYQQFFAGVTQDERDFAVLRAKIFAKAQREEPAREEDGGVDYYMNGPDAGVCNLREKTITDKRGRTLGRIAISSDVTEDRETLRLLEEAAGLDALTGLLNRHRMQEILTKADRAENLPLAVVVGDLNNLKNVNDRLGHQQGDVMLRVAAETLVTAAPPSASVARMGGDEFMLVVPRFSQEQADRLVREIRARLVRQQGNRPFEVALALGAAVKEGATQPLDEAIHRADQAMYADKSMWHERNENKI